MAIRKLGSSKSLRPTPRAVLYNVVITLSIVTVYLSVGSIFYLSVEEKPCEGIDAPEDCAEAWTLIDSLYFTMASMSTVGYGDFSPSSDVSRAFTVVYIVVGVTVVFSRLAASLGGVLAHMEFFLRHMLDRFNHHEARTVDARPLGLGGRHVDINGDGIMDFVAPPSALVYWFQGLICGVVVLFSLQCVSAAVFTRAQSGLAYKDAFYHCIVTALTVGYGDVPLTTQAARLWAVFHIALSVAWLAAFLSRVDELRHARRLQLQRVALLEKQLDEELITSLDRDGLGVDKLEFVVGMLISLGVQMCGETLKWEDVKPFIARFEASDVDKSGRLTHDDLCLIARHRHEELDAMMQPSTELGKKASNRIIPVPSCTEDADPGVQELD